MSTRENWNHQSTASTAIKKILIKCTGRTVNNVKTRLIKQVYTNFGPFQISLHKFWTSLDNNMIVISLSRKGLDFVSGKDSGAHPGFLLYTRQNWSHQRQFKVLRLLSSTTNRDKKELKNKTNSHKFRQQSYNSMLPFRESASWQNFLFLFLNSGKKFKSCFVELK